MRRGKGKMAGKEIGAEGKGEREGREEKRIYIVYCKTLPTYNVYTGPTFEISCDNSIANGF